MDGRLSPAASLLRAPYGANKNINKIWLIKTVLCTYLLLKKLPDNERIRSPLKARRVAIALVSTGWLDIYSMINENINGNFCRSMFNRGNDFTIDNSLGS